MSNAVHLTTAEAVRHFRAIAGGSGNAARIAELEWPTDPTWQRFAERARRQERRARKAADRLSRVAR